MKITLTLLVAAAATSAACASADTAGERASTVADTGMVAVADSARPAAPAPVAAAPLVATPDTIRGLYVNRWAAIGSRMWELIEVARTTEVNALVIDVKDDRGLMLYDSDVPLANEIGADTVQPMSLRRLRAVLDTMRAHGIYPIARIVVAKDPLLAENRSALAIRLRANPSEPWRDKAGRPWLDPTHQEVWKYAADLGAEAVRHGFSEIQLDYVRFPDEDRIIREGEYARMNGRIRARVIRDQLGYTRALLKPLGVPMTIDVFGLTATDTTDMGIGQQWEMFVDQADMILPMNYPSHFAPGTYKISNPNANPYRVIDQVMKDTRRRTAAVPGAGKIVPWYQDFTLGAPRYGAEEVRAQIRAGEANGYPDWILWNPGSRYSTGAFRKTGGAGGERGT